jgi:hypothetical protein
VGNNEEKEEETQGERRNQKYKFPEFDRPKFKIQFGPSGVKGATTMFWCVS